MKKMKQSLVGIVVVVMLVFMQLSSVLAGNVMDSNNSSDTPFNVEKNYFTTLTVDALSKLYEQKYAQLTNYETIYLSTSAKDFTLSQDVMQYLKNEKKSIVIAYTNGSVVVQDVYIWGLELSNIDAALDVHFSDIVMGDNYNQISNSFSKYGVVDSSFTVSLPDSQIKGVSYSAISTHDNSYNIYQYYSDDQTFSRMEPPMNKVVLNSGTYFAVKTDKDNLIGISKKNTHYLKQLDDTVVRGLAHFNYDYVYVSSDVSKFNLSSETVSYLNKSSSKFSFVTYDVNSDLMMAITSFDKGFLSDGDLEYKFPIVTVSDSNAQIEKVFSGGTAERYYTVTKQENTALGVSTKLLSPGVKTWYAYYNGVCVPIAFNTNQSTCIGFDNLTYFSVPSEKDTYVKTAAGSWVGKYSYLTDVSSATIKNIIKYFSEDGHFNGTYNIRTIADKIELDAETVSLLTNPLGGTFNIDFVSADNQKLGSAFMINRSLFKPGNMTIERPVLEFSSSSETMSQLLPAGTPAIYVTSKSTVIPGIAYSYSNPGVLGNYLQKNTKYYLLRAQNNKLTGDIWTNNNALPSDTGNYCLVKDSDYQKVLNPASPNPTSQDSQVPANQNTSDSGAESVQEDTMVATAQESADSQLSQQNIQTSDSTHIRGYVVSAVAGVSVLGAMVLMEKRKKKSV